MRCLNELIICKANKEDTYVGRVYPKVPDILVQLGLIIDTHHGRNQCHESFVIALTKVDELVLNELTLKYFTLQIKKQPLNESLFFILLITIS
jgi:hypothetical protein